MSILFSMILALFAMFLSLDWLTPHREAQARVDAAQRKADEEAERKQLELRAETRKKVALELQRALAYVGITIELSETERTVLLGDYEVSLANGLRTYHKTHNGAAYISFMLHIRKLAVAAHETYEHLGDLWAVQTVNIEFSQDKADELSDNRMAYIANAIDRIEAEIPNLVKRRTQQIADHEEQQRQWAEYAAEQEARRQTHEADRAVEQFIAEEARKEPTLAEQLENVLNRMINRKINEQYNSEY